LLRICFAIHRHILIRGLLQIPDGRLRPSLNLPRERSSHAQHDFFTVAPTIITVKTNGGNPL